MFQKIGGGGGGGQRLFEQWQMALFLLLLIDLATLSLRFLHYFTVPQSTDGPTITSIQHLSVTQLTSPLRFGVTRDWRGKKEYFVFNTVKFSFQYRITSFVSDLSVMQDIIKIRQTRKNEKIATISSLSQQALVNKRNSDRSEQTFKVNLGLSIAFLISEKNPSAVYYIVVYDLEMFNLGVRAKLAIILDAKATMRMTIMIVDDNCQ